MTQTDCIRNIPDIPPRFYGIHFFAGSRADAKAEADARLKKQREENEDFEWDNLYILDDTGPKLRFKRLGNSTNLRGVEDFQYIPYRDVDDYDLQPYFENPDNVEELLKYIKENETGRYDNIWLDEQQQYFNVPRGLRRPSLKRTLWGFPRFLTYRVPKNARDPGDDGKRIYVLNDKRQQYQEVPRDHWGKNGWPDYLDVVARFEHTSATPDMWNFSDDNYRTNQAVTDFASRLAAVTDRLKKKNDDITKFTEMVVVPKGARQRRYITLAEKRVAEEKRADMDEVVAQPKPPANTGRVAISPASNVKAVPVTTAPPPAPKKVPITPPPAPSTPAVQPARRRIQPVLVDRTSVAYNEDVYRQQRGNFINGELKSIMQPKQEDVDRMVFDSDDNGIIFYAVDAKKKDFARDKHGNLIRYAGPTEGLPPDVFNEVARPHFIEGLSDNVVDEYLVLKRELEREKQMRLLEWESRNAYPESLRDELKERLDKMLNVLGFSNFSEFNEFTSSHPIKSKGSESQPITVPSDDSGNPAPAVVLPTPPQAPVGLSTTKEFKIFDYAPGQTTNERFGTRAVGFLKVVSYDEDFEVCREHLNKLVKTVGSDVFQDVYYAMYPVPIARNLVSLCPIGMRDPPPGVPIEGNPRFLVESEISHYVNLLQGYLRFYGNPRLCPYGRPIMELDQTFDFLDPDLVLVIVSKMRNPAYSKKTSADTQWDWISIAPGIKYYAFPLNLGAHWVAVMIHFLPPSPSTSARRIEVFVYDSLTGDITEHTKDLIRKVLAHLTYDTGGSRIATFSDSTPLEVTRWMKATQRPFFHQLDNESCGFATLWFLRSLMMKYLSNPKEYLPVLPWTFAYSTGNEPSENNPLREQRKKQIFCEYMHQQINYRENAASPPSLMILPPRTQPTQAVQPLQPVLPRAPPAISAIRLSELQPTPQQTTPQLDIPTKHRPRRTQKKLDEAAKRSDAMGTTPVSSKRPSSAKVDSDSGPITKRARSDLFGAEPAMMQDGDDDDDDDDDDPPLLYGDPADGFHVRNGKKFINVL